MTVLKKSHREKPRFSPPWRFAVTPFLAELIMVVISVIKEEGPLYSPFFFGLITP